VKEKEIKYYSTNHKAPEVNFREALLRGLAPDGGLYMPRVIPKFSNKEMEDLNDLDYPNLAFAVLDKFLYSEIDSEDLKSLCYDAYNFNIPIENILDRTFVLRLDQGPTASFKDFAARMMARLMNYFISRDNVRLTILTATSGDTGSAVASAFQGLKNIDVIILFPYSEVTEMQRKQMTSVDRNIRVIAVDGKFDDCQYMVKKAFLDPSLKGLSSANSINIGRLLPQSVYYLYAWAQLRKDISDTPVFSVPSGNYGNMMGGVIAREMGLPMSKMIIATNQNNEVPEYLRTGTYKIISPSINCISSAMNVGHPSNLARLVALYGGIMDEKGSIMKEPDLLKMQKDFFAVFVDDETTRSIISEAFNKHKLLLEPHGAIAWRGIESFKQVMKSSADQLFISLETAHPSKFMNEVSRILGFTPSAPDSFKALENKKEHFTMMDNNYEKLREFLLKN
jgi:threonine synthase